MAACVLVHVLWLRALKRVPVVCTVCVVCHPTGPVQHTLVRVFSLLLRAVLHRGLAQGHHYYVLGQVAALHRQATLRFEHRAHPKTRRRLGCLHRARTYLCAAYVAHPHVEELLQALRASKQKGQRELAW